MKSAAVQHLKQFRRTHRSGFTLIEMLISVTLVLLMMVLFAEIFELASDSMTLQRALADNDQKVRAFTTVLRSDLQKRTFERVVPFHPRESLTVQNVQTESFGPRRGYFYLSLNDPDNAVDNMLQFTALTTIRGENSDETPYYGNAVGLVSTDPTLGSVNQVQDHIRRNSQQPEHDDGELQLNFAGASKAAEIAYYVRGGRLYRRAILIRDPISVAGSSTPQPRFTWDTTTGQPEATPIEYFRHNTSATASRPQTVNGRYAKYDPSAAGGASLSDDYWLDFGYSAYAQTQSSSFDGAMLLDERALANDSLASSPVSLGLMRGVPDFSGTAARCYRFGFDQFTGTSREFSTSAPGTPGFFFLGRYTSEEMSHVDFNFPQNPSADDNGDGVSIGGANPMSYSTTITDANGDGAVDEFVAGDRRGEDLLLSNVHAFEVDIWDERIGAFVQPGHTLTTAGGEPGDYHRLRNLQLNQSTPQIIVPSGSPAAWNTPPYDNWTGRIFDTWHTQNDIDGDGTADDRPPYRPLVFYPPSGNDYYGPGNTAPAPTRPLWAVNQTYNVGDVVFPLSDFTSVPPTNPPFDFSRYYVCITAGTSGATNGDEPSWSRVPGAVVDATTPGEPRWVTRANTRPLRTIRIRVRFLHEASGKMRQLSLIHSLFKPAE